MGATARSLLRRFTSVALDENFCYNALGTDWNNNLAERFVLPPSGASHSTLANTQQSNLSGIFSYFKSFHSSENFHCVSCERKINKTPPSSSLHSKIRGEEWSIFLYAGGKCNSATAIFPHWSCNAVRDWLLFPSPTIHDDGARGRCRGSVNIKLEETVAELSSIHLITSMPCPGRPHPLPVAQAAPAVPPSKQGGNNSVAVREHGKRRDPHPKTNCRLLWEACEESGGEGGGGGGGGLDLTRCGSGCKSGWASQVMCCCGRLKSVRVVFMVVTNWLTLTCP